MEMVSGGAELCFMLYERRKNFKKAYEISNSDKS